MSEFTRTIECSLPGLEEVRVTYNMMATAEQVTNMHARVGGDGSHVGIVVNVEGWPKAEYGANPFDTKTAPMVWFGWFARKGWAIAMKAYLDDPN